MISNQLRRHRGRKLLAVTPITEGSTPSLECKLNPDISSLSLPLSPTRLLSLILHWFCSCHLWQTQLVKYFCCDDVSLFLIGFSVKWQIIGCVCVGWRGGGVVVGLHFVSTTALSSFFAEALASSSMTAQGPSWQTCKQAETNILPSNLYLGYQWRD